MGAAIGSASGLALLSTGIAAVGTVSSINAQKAALARENKRVETEAKLAELAALQEENQRLDDLNRSIASNLAFQSIAGYYDDSRSFLNIQEQTKQNAQKDIAQIRLMGSTVQSKYGQMKFENTMKSQDLVFGGYASVAAGLTAGYGSYVDNKQTETALSKISGVKPNTVGGIIG